MILLLFFIVVVVVVVVDVVFLVVEEEEENFLFFWNDKRRFANFLRVAKRVVSTLFVASFSSSANTFSTSCSSVNDVSIVAYMCVCVCVSFWIILWFREKDYSKCAWFKYIYIYISMVYIYITTYILLFRKNFLHLIFYPNFTLFFLF